MDEVLPLCASPRSLFLTAWTVSNQTVRQSFNAVVLSFKKFRWAVPGPFAPSNGGKPTLVGYDICWFIFSGVPFNCMLTALNNLTGAPSVLMIFAVLRTIFLLGGFIIHMVLLYSIVYWYRDTPFRLIGAKAKFMIEVIPVITAAALHNFLVFNYRYLALLLGCTTYIYTFAHFLHAAYDIGAIDVLLGIVMPIFAYMVKGDLLVRALALSLCFGLCFYRYMTYCAPDVPTHGKKELEQQLPC